MYIYIYILFSLTPTLRTVFFFGDRSSTRFCDSIPDVFCKARIRRADDYYILLSSFFKKAKYRQKDSARHESATNTAREERPSWFLRRAHMYGVKNKPHNKRNLFAASLWQEIKLQHLRYVTGSSSGMTNESRSESVASPHTERKEIILWLHCHFSRILRCSKHCSESLHWHVQWFLLMVLLY